MISSTWLALVVVLGFSSDAPAVDTPRDVIFLAEDRPIFVRFRLMVGDRPWEAAWPESIQAIYACLDRDGDGMLTTKEADKAALAALIRLSTSGVTAIGELDQDPKDGMISTDEFATALRPLIGPFQSLVGRVANRRTDALFDHLDRDKDGQLTRLELAAIAGSLRRFDLDDNEMISPDELEPFNNPAIAVQAETAASRQARFTTTPPVVERVAGESSLRLSRLLLKKYDKGPARPDGKLSPEEFAIDPQTFASTDTSGDGTLNTEELRRYLDGSPVDLELEIAFSADDSGQAVTRVGNQDRLSKGVEVRQLGGGDIELAIGRVRIDIHVDGGAIAAKEARTILNRRFQASDTNKNGYLENKELTGLNSAGPLAGLTAVIDRDADGKLYPQELADFLDRQFAIARGRVVITTSEQGRAIFGILDRDRDLRLSARELMRTVDRVISWDSDGDGRVSADEIPYHLQVTITRGELSGLAFNGAAGAVPVLQAMSSLPPRLTVGPEWFRLMDRNGDGDISRREFLGSREQFDTLDRDQDGLIDAKEADEAKAPGG